eukprot:1569373-Prymnesium_polylepis.2
MVWQASHGCIGSWYSLSCVLCGCRLAAVAAQFVWHGRATAVVWYVHSVGRVLLSTDGELRV